MANHSLPTQSSTYQDFVNQLDARLDDLALGLDTTNTTMTNLPVNSVGWSSAENKWKKWTGSSWVDLTTTYSISISGTANAAATLQTSRNINGVGFNGSTDISIPTSNSITFNNTGSGASSGAAFNGLAERTISYNTIGAPSIDGTNATGTWNISILGNAATVTNGVYLSGTQAIGGVKTFSGSINHTIVPIATSAIDCSIGNYFTKTISSNTTFTVSNVPSSVFYTMVLEITHTSGTITWFSGVRWPNNASPTLSTGKTHLFVFTTDNGGTTWRAASLVNYTN